MPVPPSSPFVFLFLWPPANEMKGKEEKRRVKGEAKDSELRDRHPRAPDS